MPGAEEVRELIEKWQLQKKIEEKFMRRLRSLEEGDVKQVVRNFSELWETREKYRLHLKKRIEKGHISSEIEYIREIMKTLAGHTSTVIYEAPKWKSSDFWHRIFYSRKCDWVVVLGESGSILTAYKVEKEEFQKSLEQLEKVGYKPFKGTANEEIKEICRRILLLVEGKQ